MRLLRKIRLRFRSLFNRSSVEEDLETELRDYIECEIESEIAAGSSLDDARQIVARRMQGKEQIKEVCRDARGTLRIENLVRDFRYGWRVLLNNPGFSITASLTLALGIATSTALFSVIESQLWRPLPFTQPEKLAVIWERNVKQEWQQTSVSVPDFADWRQRTHAFESLAAMQWPSQRIFVGNRWTERPRVAAISSGFFETLRAQPECGRTFDARNEQPGNQTVAILSGGLARRAFGSAEAALGRTIKLDGQRYSVIGVLPATFQLDVLRTPDVFVPLAVSSAQARDARNLLVIGRLRPEVTRAQGLAELEAIAKRIAAEYPDTNANFRVMVQNPRDAFISSSSRTWLLLLLAFSAFVLLIACFNVATLQLMRSVVRQREFAVREALGASRGAMFRQAIAESAWLATVGAVLGVLLALAGLHALKAVALTDLTVRESDISINLWSVAFVVSISAFATLLFGLAPGLLRSKVDLELALRDAGRSTSNSPTTRRRIAFLSGAEVTLAFLSLFGAGLFAHSCRDMQRIPLGFDPDHISSLQISLSGAKYSAQNAIERFYKKVTEQASSVTGIQQFALSSSLPLTGGIEVKFARADRTRR
jgi:putative ABC transport system permease protein